MLFFNSRIILRIIITALNTAILFGLININSKLSYGKNNEYDYCVVGSGIGGGTLVSKLVDSGASVLLIEAGNKGHKSSDYITKGRPFGLRSTTSVQLGGTSNLWHGVLSFLDDIDFKKRNWINKSGWPIKLKDLMPYYKNVAPLFGIKDFNYFLKIKFLKN